MNNKELPIIQAKKLFGMHSEHSPILQEYLDTVSHSFSISKKRDVKVAVK